MTFAYPDFLWLLAVIPPGLGLFFWWSARERKKLTAQFIQARLLPGLVAGVSVARQRVRAVILVVAVACLILALARPQWGYELQEVRQRGLDIVVAIDTSKSMLAEDIAPNRLTRAKLAALDLMQQAKSDRLGLVAFAGTAFLQCPLTIDDAAFRQSVEALDVNTLPSGGTAIGEAITTALKTFKEADNYKVLVLLTDGEDHDSDAEEAAKKAADAGMRIYAIGIGTAEGELLPIHGANGQIDYIRDEHRNAVKSHLDEKLLRQLAAATPDGLYLPLRANTMDVLYQGHLAPLPKSDSKEKWVKQPRERYHWPLALGILLLALEMFFPERRRAPGKTTGATLTRPAVAQAALWLMLLLPCAALGSTASALREYQAGNYREAMTEYERLIGQTTDITNQLEQLEKVLKKYEDDKNQEAEALIKEYTDKAGASDGRLNFNAGAAAYKAGNVRNAALHFMAATTDPDWKLQERAHYNLGNSLFRFGEQAAGKKRKKSLWKYALASYQLALGLDPKDEDAKFNREFVEKKLKELEQQQKQQDQNKSRPPSEAAKKAKAQADEAVRRREYPRALEIMENQLQQDPTTAYYSDYIERLSEIKDVQETVHH